MSEQRWTIWVCSGCRTDASEDCRCAPDSDATDVPVEVMPVSEHEEVDADLRSLRCELATLLGPRKPRTGVTANAQWIAAVGTVLGERDRLREAAQAVLKDHGGPENDEILIEWFGIDMRPLRAALDNTEEAR